MTGIVTKKINDKNSILMGRIIDRQGILQIELNLRIWSQKIYEES